MAPKPQTVIKPTKAAAPAVTKPLKERPTAAPNKRHTPQRSSMLMRRYVKKPMTTAKPAEIKSFNKKRPTLAAYKTSTNTQKSPYISKFKTTPKPYVIKKVEPITVAVAPEKKQVFNTPPGAATTPKTVSHKNTSQSEKLFNKALKNAAPAPKLKRAPRKHKKALRWSSGITAAFLLVGFVTYLNLPNINIKFAGMQAGFSASIPSYNPSGYSFNGPINYEAGKVIVNFKSNTDERAYKIKQEVSSWNSQSLQENFLASADKKFTTSQEDGKTIYLYDDGSATWVNGGIWYQVESNSLSSDQLLNIASSI